MAFGCGKKSDPPVPPFLLPGHQNKTPTYEEGIEFWREMADHYAEIQLFEFGETDAGYPLHLVVISNRISPDLRTALETPHQKLLINNAIHPGEPDGVDASMVFAHELMTVDSLKLNLAATDIFIIPFYNIGGALNRNSTSRANQNGPEEYGFRGNAQNLDLNRDFIKCDSKNARSFAWLIHQLDPDFYIETHVSNGADYPYVMTYLATQEDVIGGEMGKILRNSVTPILKQSMIARGFEMAPYVNVFNQSPDSGFACFYDQPRYSSGYLSLFGIPGFITETHMLKPYAQRVNATLAFLHCGLEMMQRTRLQDIKDADREYLKGATRISIDWALDSTVLDSIYFKGYEAGLRESEVSGFDRLFYDRTKRWERNIPYWSRMKPTVTVTVPDRYILRRGFSDVEDRLRMNGVRMEPVGKDTVLEVEVYLIDTFSTSTAPYEKHYFHYKTRIKKEQRRVKIHANDYFIYTNDTYKKYLVTVLEPECPDAFFNWNFFDAILQQKEWFSSYVFEDEAAHLLEENPELKAEFEKQKSNPEFANNPNEQLIWIYRHSDRYEKEHLLYPVYRYFE